MLVKKALLDTSHLLHTRIATAQKTSAANAYALVDPSAPKQHP